MIITYRGYFNYYLAKDKPVKGKRRPHKTYHFKNKPMSWINSHRRGLKKSKKYEYLGAKYVDNRLPRLQKDKR